MQVQPMTGISPLEDEVVGRFLRRAGRASVAGLLGIMEMEDVWMDSTASEAMQILSNSSDEVVQTMRSGRDDVADELYGAVDHGYRLARILLGTIMLKPNYSLGGTDSEGSLLRLLASVKLISDVEIEELLTGAPQDAVELLVSPLIARGAPIRKSLGITKAIDIVYERVYSGVKLALSEEAIFSLSRTALLP
jgi:hypothetical protein